MKTLMISAAAFAALGAPALTLAAPIAPIVQNAVTATDAEVEAMAEVMPLIQRIMTSYQPRIEAAADEAARNEAEQARYAALEQAVEGVGLTTARYNELAEAARADEALAGRITAAASASAEADAG